MKEADSAHRAEGPGLKPTLIQGGLFVGLKPHADPERPSAASEVVGGNRAGK
jgi:hypothetical protein